MSGRVKIKQINNEVVQAVPKLGGQDMRPVLGADIMPMAFGNVFFSARKMSGKTSALFHVLKKCTGKNTRIVAFVSTLYNDDSWIYIRKYFENKGIDFEGYTSMIDEDGVDLLAQLVDELKKQAEAEQMAEEEEMDEQEAKRDGFFKAFNKKNLEPKEKKKKKPKYLAPDIIIVLDDLSNELKSPTLVTLLKNHRHFKSKTLISSQYYHDLLPASRNQIDYFALFKGQTEKKLELIYKDAQVSLTYPQFEALYEDATSAPYGFLWIDKQQEKFRKGFNKEYELPKEE